MRLELKHFAPYLPYGLKVKENSGMQREMLLRTVGFYPKNNRHLADVDLGKSTVVRMYFEEFKPILRPLSDLTKEIEHNGERFVPMREILKMRSAKWDAFATIKKHELYKSFKVDLSVRRIHYDIVQKLHEWHFDTEGLIHAGLAIDINTLNK